MQHYIGQTVKMFNGAHGHVTYHGDELHVRSAEGTRVVFDANTYLEVISEEALPLHPLNGVEQVQVISTREPKDNGNTTKLQRALAMFDASKSRQDMIKQYITELNMTSAGASTYYATAKKRCAQ